MAILESQLNIDDSRPKGFENICPQPCFIDAYEMCVDFAKGESFYSGRPLYIYGYNECSKKHIEDLLKAVYMSNKDKTLLLWDYRLNDIEKEIREAKNRKSELRKLFDGYEVIIIENVIRETERVSFHLINDIIRFCISSGKRILLSGYAHPSDIPGIELITTSKDFVTAGIGGSINNDDYEYMIQPYDRGFRYRYREPRLYRQVINEYIDKTGINFRILVSDTDIESEAREHRNAIWYILFKYGKINEAQIAAIYNTDIGTVMKNLNVFEDTLEEDEFYKHMVSSIVKELMGMKCSKTELYIPMQYEASGEIRDIRDFDKHMEYIIQELRDHDITDISIRDEEGYYITKSGSINHMHNKVLYFYNNELSSDRVIPSIANYIRNQMNQETVLVVRDGDLKFYGEKDIDDAKMV